MRLALCQCGDPYRSAYDKAMVNIGLCIYCAHYTSEYAVNCMWLWHCKYTLAMGTVTENIQLIVVMIVVYIILFNNSLLFINYYINQSRAHASSMGRLNVNSSWRMCDSCDLCNKETTYMLCIEYMNIPSYWVKRIVVFNPYHFQKFLVSLRQRYFLCLCSFLIEQRYEGRSWSAFAPWVC